MKRLCRLSACLAAMLLAMAACSPKETAKPAAPAGPGQFTIIPTDVAGIAEVTVGTSAGTNGCVLHQQFTDEKAKQFREFTRAHVNQRVQLLVGRKVVAEPVIAAEISNGQADLSFATAEQARAVMRILGKPK